MQISARAGEQATKRKLARSPFARARDVGASSSASGALKRRRPTTKIADNWRYRFSSLSFLVSGAVLRPPSPTAGGALSAREISADSFARRRRRRWRRRRRRQVATGRFSSSRARACACSLKRTLWIGSPFLAIRIVKTLAACNNKNNTRKSAGGGLLAPRSAVEWNVYKRADARNCVLQIFACL